MDDNVDDAGEHSNASGVDSSHARLSQGGCCRGELHHPCHNFSPGSMLIIMFITR